MKKLTKIAFAFWLCCMGSHAYAQDLPIPISATSKLSSKKGGAEQRYLRIGKIFIVGNKQTKPHIILREMDVQEGDIFYLPDLQEILVNDKNKLINTKLFNAVDMHLVEVDKFLVDLIIEVNERWYTFPIPILSLADRNFNDWIQNHDAKLNRLNYGLRFYQYNMRGRNERLRGIAQFGFTKKFELSYSIPYINTAQKNGLTLHGGYAENKSIAYNTSQHKLEFVTDEKVLQESFSGGLSFSHRSNFYSTQHFNLGYHFNSINDTIAFLNDAYLLNGQIRQRYFQLGYKYDRDKRDIRAYPLTGYQFVFEASKLGLGVFDDLNKFEFYSNYGKYFDLGNQLYLSTSLTGKATTPKRQPYINFQGLGYGKDFIRGYELYVIEGQHYFINKLTLKKRLAAGSANFQSLLPIDQFNIMPFAVYIKAYFDSGIVSNSYSNPENHPLANRYIYGGGIGLDIVTFYDTVIRLEYSINKQQEGGFFFHFRSDI